MGGWYGNIVIDIQLAANLLFEEITHIAALNKVEQNDLVRFGYSYIVRAETKKQAF